MPRDKRKTRVGSLEITDEDMAKFEKNLPKAPRLGSPTREDLEFVYQNIDVDDGFVAPSPGAEYLLKLARDSERIYESVISRLMPRTFVEEDTVGADLRAMELTGIGEMLRKELDAELQGCSEDPGYESPVPKEAVGDGEQG